MHRNPIYQLEMTTTVRSRTQAIVWIVFSCLLVLTGLIILYTFSVEAQQRGYIDYSVMRQLYIMLTSAVFLLMLAVLPLTAAAAISSEREHHTMELLLHTAVSPTRIVLGKLGAILVNTLFMCSLSLPVLALVFIFGSIPLLNLLQLIGCLMIEILYCGSIGLLISTFFRAGTPAVFTVYCLTVLCNFPGIYTLLADIFGLAYTGIHFQIGALYDFYLLLPVPTVAFYELISAQTGTVNAVLELISHTHAGVANPVTTHWLTVSLLLHGLLTLLAVLLTIRRIHPKHRRY